MNLVFPIYTKYFIVPMKKIFCLETEWAQSVHSKKNSSSTLSLLDFLQNSDKRISFIFRNVVTKEDFNFYIIYITILIVHLTLLMSVFMVQNRVYH